MARSDPEGPFIKLSSPETEEFWKIPVLYEDDDLFVIDKPAHLLSSPDRYDPNRPNLMKLLHRDIERGAPWAAERKLNYLSNAHRLDFETSGVFLLVKNKPALVAMANQFGSEKPNKSYLAIVEGTASQPQFSTEAKLGPHPFHLGLMRVDIKRGKRSKTDFEVAEQFKGYSLFRCFPRTGRTHQIRVHLEHLGFPIIGDLQYHGRPLFLSSIKKNYRKGTDDELPLIRRVALHAESLEITHPTSGETVRMEAKLPKDFQVTLKYLRKYASGGPPVFEGTPSDDDASATGTNEGSDD
ncbi:MAG: RluA family pseudouridine synthase [Verrucomicrobiales bacterium]